MIFSSGHPERQTSNASQEEASIIIGLPITRGTITTMFLYRKANKITRRRWSLGTME